MFNPPGSPWITWAKAVTAFETRKSDIAPDDADWNPNPAFERYRSSNWTGGDIFTRRRLRICQLIWTTGSESVSSLTGAAEKRS